MTGGLRLIHLTFTGLTVEPVTLKFEDGLNILYGASNTGKSFTVKTLNFMFGGSKPLPGIEQKADFDAVWLGLNLPNGRNVTLYRATSGGDFRLFDGLVTSTVGIEPALYLAAQHHPKQDNNLSRFLLKEIGLDQKVVVKNMNGEKESLSFRHIAPYMFISEEIIISERSPILFSGQVINETAEKNIFRVLLTGLDDAAVVTTLNAKTHKVVREAKLEIVNELIAQIDDELGEEAPSRDDLLHQTKHLEDSLATLHTDLLDTQNKIDSLVSHRRDLSDKHENASEHLYELEVMLGRFKKLATVYASDVARLEALEEGGFLLMTLAGRDCTVCGAPPEAQRHIHGVDEIKRFHQAATAEIRKIQRERWELQQTTTSLSAEAEGIQSRLAALMSELQVVEKELADLRPIESQTRRRYELLTVKRVEIGHILDLYERRDRLMTRRHQLEIKQKSRKKADKLSVGINGQTAFAFARTLQEVLNAWRFPGAQDVQFDSERQDLQIGGKERAANGKGVRALLHSAFKIAVLIYCRNRNLPHPGIVVLDTPLLTYREPLRNPKHGELMADELAIKRTNLAEYFYTHLASLRELGQIVVVENSDPPSTAIDLAFVQLFTGEVDTDRFGFFPPLDELRYHA